MLIVIMIVWFRVGGELFERVIIEIKLNGVLMFIRVIGEE